MPLGRILGLRLRLGRHVANEVVELALGVFFLEAVMLLQAAEQLVLFAGDPLEVVVGEFRPLATNLTLELFPVTFDLVPVHGSSNATEEPHAERVPAKTP